jgi:glutamine synthetase
MKHRTAVIHCFVGDPVTGESYTRDPRYVAKKAEDYLKASGIADTAYFGPEAEFFVFDDVRFGTKPNGSFYEVDSIEGEWNTGADEGPNLGYKPRTKQGYFPVPPMDHYQDLRSDMMLSLNAVGIETELHHHEVASGGQGEIGIKFNTLLRQADNLMTFKYVLKNVAWQAGKSLTFMPKPIFQDNGSGMHTHQSLWKGGEPLFFDEKGYAGLSDIAVGTSAVCSPTRTRSSPSPTRRPTRSSDWCRVRGAGEPGVQPAEPFGVVPHPARVAEPEGEARRVPVPRLHVEPVPRLLGDDARGPRRHHEPDRAADARRPRPLRPAARRAGRHPAGAVEPRRGARRVGGRQRVPEGRGVFTDDLIETWVDYKRINEIDAIRLRPHPYEFNLYYDI